MKISNLKKTILVLSFLTATISLAAQEKHCGNVQAQEKLLEEYPDLKAKINALDAYANTMDLSKMEKHTRGDSTTVYIIPIVFHIIHNYGPENISDAQILDEMNILKQDYRGRNTDTSLIIIPYKHKIADVRFEYRLATIDPNGNCTNGIDRVNSYKTYFADDKSKLNGWPRNKYVNVWVTQTIGSNGVAGYAYMPSSAQYMPMYDGVLILNNYIGSIGTSAPFSSIALTHELGHVMNLMHLWGGTNEPGCTNNPNNPNPLGLNTPCGDDNVADTPPTRGHDYCPTNMYDSIYLGPSQGPCTEIATSPGKAVIENLQNYMEYTYCPGHMFTNGQRDRMRDALTNTMAERSNLISAINAASVGILDSQASPNCHLKADFNTFQRFFCIGTSTTIKNYSYQNTISSRGWNFPDADAHGTGLITDNVSVNFDAKGWKTVSLMVSHDTMVTNLTRNNYLYVSDPTDMNPTNVNTEFEDPNDYARWPIFNYFNNPFTWKYYDGGNTPTGWRALMFEGFDSRTYPAKYTATPYEDIDDIFTPAYNTSALTGGYLSFKLAAASIAGSATQLDDSLIIYSSKDCGVTWKVIKNLNNAALINNGSLSTPFFPTAATTWSTVSIPLNANSISPTTYFKIRYRGGTYSNNLFIDNFMVGSYPTAVSNVTEDVLFTVMPNPASDNATVLVNTKNGETVKITVSDMIGRIIYTDNVKTIANEKTTYQLPSAMFATKGMYLVTATYGNNKKSQKLVIQ